MNILVSQLRVYFRQEFTKFSSNLNLCKDSNSLRARSVKADIQEGTELHEIPRQLFPLNIPDLNLLLSQFYLFP